MSRGLITRTSSDICADCSTTDPKWASINRGVLVCDECCSVHRSLGRHISQVKSLKKGSWSSTQLAMVHQVVSMGANNIWEHSLLDPSQNKQGRRKPNPRDPIHPTKADFIRAKYQFLAFVNKHKDSEIGSAEDLSKQLHSSVRTGNLETSLRLLSLGADPNFFHPDRGTSPLHVAAQAAQILQIELLVVYGADPGAFDANGKTPVEHAKKENFPDIADRLVECQYELTDRLAFYLCGRKPDHRSQQHFIIPEMADSSLDLSELAKAAKKKLQALPNHLFEELAMDVYDEVDRRENETIWLSTQNHSSLVSDRQTVPFLPVNPEFSSTRNQGRQKLARFNAREFATLIIDILNDARRRQLGISSPSHTPKDRGTSDKSQLIRDRRPMAKINSNISDDEPLYDSVCSDEDYASIGDNQSLKEEDSKDKPKEEEEDTEKSMGSSDTTEAPITLEEYLEVKRKLVESNAHVQQLIQSNKDLKQEIALLQNMVHKLMQENQTLRHGDSGASEPASVNGHEVLRDLKAKAKQPRPSSMFEARDQERHHRWNKPQFQPLKEEPTTPDPAEQAKEKEEEGSKHSSSSSVRSQVKLSQANSTDSDYDNTDAELQAGAQSGSGSARSSGNSQPPPEGSGEALSSAEGAPAMPFSDSASGEEVTLPSQDDVVKKTEKITKKIQELLISAQDGKNISYAVCAEKISTAVTDMASLFPQNVQDERMQGALHLLTNGAERLKEQCAAEPPEVNGIVDQRLHTQQVIQCAYDIAKAAKQLVMLFE